MDAKPNLDDIQNTVLHGTDPQARVDAIEQLGAEEPSDALPVLLSVLTMAGPGDEALLVAALASLTDFADDLPPNLLEPALHAGNPAVRFEAVGLLGDIGTPEALVLVQSATGDPDPEVRELALGIVGLTR